MEVHAEEKAVQRGQLCQLSSCEWYVRCKWCRQEARFEAHLTEDEAIGMLCKWRESMVKTPRKYRYWACPTCAKWYDWHDDDEEEETKTTAESASERAPTTATTTDTVESASQEVQQLKAEVVELKAGIEMLKAEVVELKFEPKAEVRGHVA